MVWNWSYFNQLIRFKTKDSARKVQALGGEKASELWGGLCSSEDFRFPQICFTNLSSCSGWCAVLGLYIKTTTSEQEVDWNNKRKCCKKLKFDVNNLKTVITLMCLASSFINAVASGCLKLLKTETHRNLLAPLEPADVMSPHWGLEPKTQQRGKRENDL